MNVEVQGLLAQIFEVPVENILDCQVRDGYAAVKLWKACELGQVATGTFGEQEVPSTDYCKLSRLFNVPVSCLRGSIHLPGRVTVEIHIPRSEHGSWEEIAAVLSADPICDGCTVSSPHQHHCHGNRSMIQGVQTTFPCTCQSCAELAAL